MKRFRLILSVLFSIFTALSLSGCGGKETVTISLSQGDFSIFFENLAEGSVTLADGIDYREGELLPVFAELSALLSVDFIKSDDGGDILFGGAAELSRRGATGEFLNLAEHLDAMPNFNAFLENNPLVRLSVSASESGAFYVIPYLENTESAELLFNADAVRALLDGEGKFVSDSEGEITDVFYAPYMPTSGSITVDIMLDGRLTALKKNYDAAGNIIEFMNYEIRRGRVSAVDAVNMLRSYIDDAYCGFYGSLRSELFLGESAAWDADELVALLRCATALGGEYSELFAYGAESLTSLAGALFSVPGLLSCDYFYFDSEWGLCDARCDLESYRALLRMRAVIDEGLLGCGVAFTGESDSLPSAFTEVLPPVSLLGNEYVRLIGTRSEISSYAATVSASVSENGERLFAVLRVIDYLFSEEGQRLARYGTPAFCSLKENGIAPSDEALANAARYTESDYSAFKYKYIGAGLLFPYGNIDASVNRITPTERGTRLGLIKRVGYLTDDGIYLPPTPVRLYTNEEYLVCDSNSYYDTYFCLFQKILNGEPRISTLADAQRLISCLVNDTSRDEYILLRREETERYLRCYKIISK